VEVSHFGFDPSLAERGKRQSSGAELFKAMAGLNIVEVPYKGVTPAFNDLISGRVQLMFAVAASVAPHVKFYIAAASSEVEEQAKKLGHGLLATELKQLRDQMRDARARIEKEDCAGAIKV
jgi:tripartite-type tricarboxylate transporter receptor subunit TctC